MEKAFTSLSLRQGMNYSKAFRAIIILPPTGDQFETF